MWHFIKFRGSPRQITVNSAADSKLKENQLWCSKYPIYYLLMLTSCHGQWIRQQTKLLSNQLL